VTGSWGDVGVAGDSCDEPVLGVVTVGDVEDVGDVGVPAVVTVAGSTLGRGLRLEKA